MSKKIILLIEDNPLLTGMYSAAFKNKGLDVFVAHDGQEGLKLVEDKKPDLVLLDIFMPGMDGFEVLEKLRADSKLKDTKVVVLSISNKKEHVERAKKLQVADYLIKSEMELNQIVQKVFEHF